MALEAAGPARRSAGSRPGDDHTNQVQELLAAMQDGLFRQIEVLEIFLRRYKPFIKSFFVR